MSKKNIDLSSYSVQNNDSIQAKSKYSDFIKNEDNRNIQETEENQEIDNNEEISDTKSGTSETKECRVNMAFSDNNYKFLLNETSKNNVNFMYFLNHIIKHTSDEEINRFMDNHPLLKGGRSSAPRRKGHKMQRINFKIYTENHEKVSNCALKNDATITAIVNAIIEIYISKNNVNIN